MNTMYLLALHRYKDINSVGKKWVKKRDVPGKDRNIHETLVPPRLRDETTGKTRSGCS